MKTFSEIIKENKSNLPNERKWWANYAFHYTDISNALGIIQRETLFSRAIALQNNCMKNDNASYQVIDMTSKEVQSFVRFYFRPLTPTQYFNEGFKHPSLRYNNDVNANVPVPIFFIFNLEKLLQNSQTKFSKSSQAGYGDELLSGEEAFSTLPFKQIYDNSATSDEERKYRHAEILFPNSYPIQDSLEAILCRNEFEQSMLLSLLLKKDKRLFYKYRPYIKVCKSNLFENNGLFLKDIYFEQNLVSFFFADSYEKWKYTNKMMLLHNITELDKIKMTFIFEWKNSKEILLRQPIECYLDYNSDNAMSFLLSHVEKATILTVSAKCYGCFIGYKEFILSEIF